jgi:sterol desaturase/sphingolipid hydroxylase (fatty acid hydroxylase superfamily)
VKKLICVMFTHVAILLDIMRYFVKKKNVKYLIASWFTNFIFCFLSYYFYHRMYLCYEKR